MRVLINSVLTASTTAYVDLPINSWDEVVSWYVKWDTLFYQTEGSDEWHERVLDSSTDDLVDWKRPKSVEISESDDDWETGEVLASYPREA
jgi:hypothetical protein